MPQAHQDYLSPTFQIVTKKSCPSKQQTTTTSGNNFEDVKMCALCSTAASRAEIQEKSEDRNLEPQGPRQQSQVRELNRAK